MIPPAAAHQMRRQAAQILASDQANASDVVLHWRERTFPAGYDPGDESSGTPTAVAKSLTFRAMVHHVDHRNSAYQRFMELETGAVLLDYLEDLTVEEKEDPRFEIGGEFYVQKSVGKQLLEMWNTRNDRFGGLFRTIALVPAK